MAIMGKMLLYAGFVILLMASARVSSAQTLPENIGLEQRDISGLPMDLNPIDIKPAEDLEIEKAGPPPAGFPVWMLISEQGIAWKDNRSYALRIIVERLIPMEPGHVQELMSSDKSLEEIKDAIGTSPEESIYHGSMKLEEEIYPLVNIRISSYADNSSILESDVAKPNQDSPLAYEMMILGHIRMKMTPSKDGLVGQGTLLMNDSSHLGTHSILIDIVAPNDGKTAFGKGNEHDVQKHSWRSPLDPGDHLGNGD